MCHYNTHLDENRYNFSHFTNEYVKIQNVSLKEVGEKCLDQKEKEYPTTL